MDFTEFIRDYGYVAIVVGTFFEGELIMLAAGMAASAGLLSLPWAIAAGIAGIFFSDTVCFLLGRLAGPRVERWFPWFHARLGRVFRLIERHDEKLIMFFQFFPGLCTVTPMAFGMTRVSAARFIALDLLGNVTWTLVFAGGGYLFGEAFGYLVGELHAWMVYVSAAIFLVMTGLLFWQGQRFLARKLER